MADSLHPRRFALVQQRLFQTIFFLFPLFLFSQTFNGTGGLDIPPNASSGATQGITFSDATVSGVGIISSCIEISVLVDINHTWVGDMGFTLTGPNGAVLDLCTDNGSSGDDFINSEFSDLGGAFVTAGSPPFTGLWRPEGRSDSPTSPWSDANALGTFTFDSQYSGSNADGIWTLTVDDHVFGDVGVLNSWSITFTGSGGGGTPSPASIDECETSFNSNIAIFDLTSVDNIVNNGSGSSVDYWEDAAATISITNSSNYSSTSTTVFASLPGGCGVTAPVTLTVLPLPLANPISFGQCDIGDGTANFDLTQIESAVLGGQSNTINWFSDIGLTSPISNITNFNSGPTDIYAEVTDGTCTNIGVLTLIVVPGPNPSNSFLTLQFIDICGDLTGNVDITFTLPSGGNFDVTFDWMDVVNGTNTTVLNGISDGHVYSFPYTGSTDFTLTDVTSASGCSGAFSSPITETLTVTVKPDLFVPNPPTICAGSSIDLAGLGAVDQNNSGASITFHSSSPPNSGNELPSTIVAPNVTTTYYAFAESGNNCNDEFPIDIIVEASGTPALSSDIICENSGFYDLSVLEDPAFTGSWSGTGVSGGFFDPSGQNGLVTLTFTPSGACASIATTDVQVTPGGTPILGTIQICETASMLDLTTLEDSNFPSGSWSGLGVSGDFFDPFGQSGFITLTFTSSNPCDNPADTDIEVLPGGTPLLFSDIICDDYRLYDLTLLEDPGFVGDWSGIGVFGTDFDPFGLDGIYTLTFTPSDPCSLPATTTMEVFPSAIPILQSDAICENSGPYDLSNLEDPSYSSGVWSGSGVLGGFFDPINRSGTIVLTFDSDEDCIADAQTTIEVIPSGQPFLDFEEICEDAGLFNLSNIGDPNFPDGTWSGTGVTGNFFDPSGLNGIIDLTFVSDEICDEIAYTTVEVLEVGPLNLGTDIICSNAGICDLWNLTDPNFTDGDWAGQGITGGGTFFDPFGLDGVYDLTFEPFNQCVLPATTTIEVNISEEPFLDFAEICESDGILDLTTLEDPAFSGIWIGNGVSGTDFDPTGLSGVINLEFDSDNFCDDPGFTTVEVTPSFSPVLGTAALCTSDGILDLQTLEDPTNPDGDWSGQGVSGTNFDPSGLAGNITLTFTPDDLCSFINTTIVAVTASGVPTLMTDQICENNGVFDLVNLQDPSFPSGVWTGSGVAQNMIDPTTVLGTINLTFTPTGNCAAPNTTMLTINPSTTPNSGLETICNNDGIFDLTQIQDPNFNGTWSGAGVSGTNFDPSSQSGEVEIIFTSQNVCDDIDTTKITVGLGGIPQLGTDSICQNNGVFDLTNLQDTLFQTGVWSGTNLSGTNFDPQTQSGVISFVFDSDNLCADDATTTLTVFENATPNLQNDTVCAASGDFDLTSLNASNYQNGIWTGTQVFNNILKTDTVFGTISLTFQSAQNCILPATTFVEILEQRQPVLDSVAICTGSDPLDLSTLNDPNFSNGNWTGQGVSNGVFTQINTPGIYNLNFASSEKCVDSATTFIEVNAAPIVSNIVENCISGNANYTVSFQISGGDPDSYLINGAPFGAGGSTIDFTSDLIVSGTNYSFEINDKNGCDVQFLTGNVDCSCQTDAGTMSNSGNPILICFGEDIQVQSTSNPNLESDDVLKYILHDSPGTSLGNIFAESDSPQFMFSSTFVAGQTYYISAVAGNDDGSSNLDFSDNCLSVAPGTPVQFYEVDAVFQTQSQLCESECLTINLNFTGVGPFSFTIELKDRPGVATLPYTVNSNDTTLIICPRDRGMSENIFTINLTQLNDQSCGKNFDASFEQTVEVFPAVTERIEPRLCPGGTRTVNGTVYDASNPTGQEVIMGTSSTGCDSLIEVNLSFFAPAENTVRPRICEGNSEKINGEIFDVTNRTAQQILPFASINGCDSIVNVEVEILTAVSSLFNPTLCEGTRVEINGTFYDEGNPNGTEIFENTTADGCDSLVFVDLTFSQFSINDLNQTLCLSESITVNGQVYDFANPTGQEVISGGSVAGCDSLINVNLQFFQAAIGDFRQTICESDFVEINSEVYNFQNPSGMEILQNASSAGCDSTVNIQLDFYTPAVAEIRQTICESDFVEINGERYDFQKPSGSETLQNASANGCDSIVNIQLEFYAPAVAEIRQTICESDFVEINGTRYDSQNPSGTETLQNASVNGCDSVINVQIDFFPLALAEINEQICETDFLEINGNRYDTQTPSGREVLQGASANGCDSVVSINLTFFAPAESQIDLDLFTGEQIEINGTVYDENNRSGTEILQGTSVNGCDSTIFIQLRFTSLTAEFDFESPNCFGDENGRILIQNIQGSNPPFEIFINGDFAEAIDASIFEINNLSGGIYTIKIIDAAGNEFEEVVELNTPISLELNLDEEIFVDLGDNVVLSPITNFTPSIWSWSPDEFLSCNDCENPIVIQPTKGIEYVVEAIDDEGCSVTARTILNVEKSFDVFVPQAFSPNDDGINDVFQIFSGPQVTAIKNFAVFDRWGNQLFGRNDLQPNSTEGWDGTWKGKKMNSGIYVFFAEIEFLDGSIEVFKGDLTLTY